MKKKKKPTFSMACKIPSAIKSQRTIPPKIFTKTPPTFASQEDEKEKEAGEYN
jgi:hypothetical protein